MKQKHFILIIATLLLSIGLFAVNDMGKGGSYDGYAMTQSGVLNIGDVALPVTLSSFTAIQTSNNLAKIAWTTQSENGLSDYNIYRNEEESFNTSTKLNTSSINATNTTSTQNYSYVDKEVDYDKTYYYWLESVELNGDTGLFGPVSLTIESPDIPDINELQSTTLLKSAYPNPFNPTTTIAFDIKEGETGTLTIFNIKGQKVVSESFVAGSHKFKWNADKNTSGVYLYKLQTNNYSKINKMLMLK